VDQYINVSGGMSEKVVSFQDVEIRGARKYLLLLVAWNDFQSGLRESLKKHSEVLGEAVGRYAAWVESYEGWKAYEEVFEKAWPEEIKVRMSNEQDPFLLIIDTSFAQFDPTTNRSAIVWFSDWGDRPSEVWKPLAALQRRILREDDLFVYFENLRIRALRSKWIGRFSKLAQYFELSLPIVPGFVSVHIDAILADSLGQLE
jgi:hypothetical protein